MRIRSEYGVSIVEAALVLTVFSVLTAVMAPAIMGYVGSARQVRARQDVQVIGEALREFIADNAENQFLEDANGTLTPLPSTPPARDDGNRVNMLISDGDVPVLASALTAASDTFWEAPYDGNLVDTFSNHLIENLPAEATNNRYRNPSDVFVASPGGKQIDFARSASSGFNAPYAWRGGYLRSPVDPDPWGNRYAANVAFLDPAPTGSITGITSGFAFADYPRVDVFVLSAGPDEEIDTKSAQDGAVPGDDDFIFIVSAHAK